MAGKYDEDVYENPYFLKIMSDHPEYLEKIVDAKGILCVPKYSIASSWTPTQEEIEDHVLLPTKDVVNDDDDFITMSNKIVHISDGKLVTKDGFTVSRQVPVLFAETFHTDAGGSYRVFCINGLLNKTVNKSETKDSTKSLSPTSYRQCLELLWSHSGGHKMRDSLDKLLNTFAVTYDRLEGETLRSIVDVANTHFTKAMQHLLKDSVVRRSAQRNPYYMDSLKVAVETYLMNSIHKHLFRVITTAMAGQDAEINKITRNLVHLQFSDLGIRKIFSQNIPAAKKELNLLNRYSTPVGRLFCLKRVVATLTKPPKSLSKESSKETVTMMTTDDLLPILIFLIIKSEIPNWMANLVFMRHFHFAKSSDDDEFGFYLASVEAALEHIKSGNIGDEIKPLKRDHWNSFLLVDSTDGPPSPSSSQSPSRQLSHSSIDDFFKYVQEGNEVKVQQMLERPYKTSEEVHLKLCHPLCSCDKCDKLLSDFRSNSDLVTAYTRDNRGYTALHIAAYYGQAQLIDLLIQNNAVVDTTDYLGLTPLHLACQRGFQNVMLLLLHFGADVMSTDNEGNTPLHLCCANGHDDCVKALVYYEASMRRLHINVANEFGDTALHFAAKWGYETIVKTLLENGADATVCNRKKQTPVSLAQNVKVQRCLQLAAEDPDFLLTKSQQFVTSASNSRSRASSTASLTNQNSAYTGHRSGKLDLYEPESASSHVVTESLEVVSDSEMKRKREKLFKAVIEGDIQLVKFYLGIQLEIDDGKDDDMDTLHTLPSSVALSDMCHPLCLCEKCRNIQRATRRWGDIMSVNSKTSTGYCPIHMAVLHNHKDVVALLIAHGADVSAQNHKSLTPLHLAVCTRNTLVTDMLVKAGARLNVCDINEETPLLMAASNGFIDGVQILIKANADVNATNHKGSTPLHEAVKRNYTAIVSSLLHAGADPRIKNKHGNLPQDECNDASLRGVLVATARRMEEAEKIALNNNNTSRDKSLKGTDGQVSIRELFAAFEEKDLQKLQNLALAIRSFNREIRLKRTKTTDKSATLLGVITQNHLIQSFDRGTLRKTKSLCKSEPDHLYLGSKSRSFDTPTDRPSTDRISTDRISTDRKSTDGSTSNILSTNILQDVDVNLQEPLTSMGDNSFDSLSGLDDSLTPLPESESLDKSGSDISSEPPENDTSPMIQASNNADIPAIGVLSNYANTRNNSLFTSEVQQTEDECSVSQLSQSESAGEKGLVVAEKHIVSDVPSYSGHSVDERSMSQPSELQSSAEKSLVDKHVVSDVPSGSNPSVKTQSDEVDSLLSFENSNGVDNISISFENDTEAMNTVAVEARSEVTNSTTYEHANVVNSSVNLEHESEDINSPYLQFGSKDKNSLNLECGNEDNSSLHLECNSEDKNSLHLKHGSEDNISLTAQNDNGVKYSQSVECDSCGKNSLIAEHEGEDKKSTNLQHDTYSLPVEDEQTTQHCHNGEEYSQSEKLVADEEIDNPPQSHSSEDNFQSEELVSVEQKDTSSDFHNSEQNSQSETLVVVEQIDTSSDFHNSEQNSQSETLVVVEQIDTSSDFHNSEQNSQSETLVVVEQKDTSSDFHNSEQNSKSEMLVVVEQIDTSSDFHNSEQNSQSETLVVVEQIDTSSDFHNSEQNSKSETLVVVEQIDTSSDFHNSEQNSKSETLVVVEQKDTSSDFHNSEQNSKSETLVVVEQKDTSSDFHNSEQNSKSEMLVVVEQIDTSSDFHNSEQNSQSETLVVVEQIDTSSDFHNSEQNSQSETLVVVEQIDTSSDFHNSEQNSQSETLVVVEQIDTSSDFHNSEQNSKSETLVVVEQIDTSSDFHNSEQNSQSETLVVVEQIDTSSDFHNSEQNSQSETLVVVEQIDTSSDFHNSEQNSKSETLVVVEQIDTTLHCRNGAQNSQNECFVADEIVTHPHCYKGVQNSQSETLVISLNQQCNGTEYIKQSQNISENDDVHHVPVEHSSVLSEAKELVSYEHEETR